MLAKIAIGWKKKKGVFLFIVTVNIPSNGNMNVVGL